MISDSALALICGLTSAATWGAGDFSGGVASKRSHVVRVLFISQMIGALLLATLALALAEPLPSTSTMAIAGLAGLAGMAGLAALYRGLARQRMGFVAPITAVVAVVISVIGGALIEGLPSVPQLSGFICALAAVWLLTRQAAGTPIAGKDLLLPIIAGLGFGLFFILIDRVIEAAVIWPLVAARLASLTLLVLFILVGKAGYRAPGMSPLALMAISGIFDAGGNAFFALAARIGRLDIAAVTSSLYPATTVLLAWLLLKERLGRRQWVGVLLAVLAIALISL